MWREIKLIKLVKGSNSFVCALFAQHFITINCYQDQHSVKQQQKRQEEKKLKTQFHHRRIRSNRKMESQQWTVPEKKASWKGKTTASRAKKSTNENCMKWNSNEIVEWKGKSKGVSKDNRAEITQCEKIKQRIKLTERTQEGIFGENNKMMLGSNLLWNYKRHTHIYWIYTFTCLLYFLGEHQHVTTSFYFTTPTHR